MNPCPAGRRGCTATLVARPAQARRGDRVVDYSRQYWQCSECRDPLTGAPLEVADGDLAARNASAAAAAWLARFGEELPARAAPGRRPGSPREERVTVLLSAEELAELDRARGHRTRSEYIRQAVVRQRAS